jgi:hypothetical protein
MRGSVGMRLLRVCSIAGLAVWLPLAAQAQGKVTFESLDKNGDGKISVAEASSHDALFVAFKDLDKDRDGNLTREEFAAFKQ